MFEKLCMNQKLRVLISSEALGGSLSDVKDIFANAFDNRLRGTLFTDSTAFKDEERPIKATEDHSVPLDKARAKLLQSWLNDRDLSAPLLRGVSINDVRMDGVIYTTVSRNPKDSRVVFGEGIPKNWKAGEIEDIFTLEQSIPGLPKSPTFVILRVFRELSTSDAKSDMFRQFDIAGGKIFYSSFNRVRVLIHADEIISHFAGTEDVVSEIEKPHIHVLPLDKVPRFYKSKFPALTKARSLRER